jgi:hypothetical protein
MDFLMFPPHLEIQELRAAVQKAEEVQLQPSEYPAAWKNGGEWRWGW